MFNVSGLLPKERAANREKNQPLCMAQYYRLLGSCRRPGNPRDSQYLPEPRDDQHVIVSCRNQVNIKNSSLKDIGTNKKNDFFFLADVLRTCKSWRPWSFE